MDPSSPELAAQSAHILLDALIAYDEDAPGGVSDQNIALALKRLEEIEAISAYRDDDGPLHVDARPVLKGAIWALVALATRASVVEGLAIETVVNELREVVDTAGSPPDKLTWWEQVLAEYDEGFRSASEAVVRERMAPKNDCLTQIGSRSKFPASPRWHKREWDLSVLDGVFSVEDAMHLSFKRSAVSKDRVRQLGVGHLRSAGYDCFATPLPDNESHASILSPLTLAIDEVRPWWEAVERVTLDEIADRTDQLAEEEEI